MDASICGLWANPVMQSGDVWVVDNSRDGTIFESLPNCNLRPLTYPVDSVACERHGHDHHTSLNKAIGESDADVLVIFDCDAHIISPNFLSYVHQKMYVEQSDAVLASDPRFECDGLSHPCFMALKTHARKISLPLDPLFVGNEGRTARMTKNVLESHGLKVHVPQRIRAFKGVMGDMYDRQVYHHGSATVADSNDSRLVGQVSP